ncbi:MAG TPA: hypothetical protein VKX49_04305 [Bryobacteraceae bacterium]|nr:hypothetical protein [Bryobacteraceae bacterium]
MFFSATGSWLGWNGFEFRDAAKELRLWIVGLVAVCGLCLSEQFSRSVFQRTAVGVSHVTLFFNQGQVVLHGNTQAFMLAIPLSLVALFVDAALGYRNTGRGIFDFHRFS